MGHTKGPWRAEGRLIIGLKEKPICEVPQHGIKRHKTDDGNAQLIAAAPDMYEACKKLVMHRHQGDIHPIDYQRIELALAKAEGKDVKYKIPDVDFTR